jgi:hypothetical protein
LSGSAFYFLVILLTVFALMAHRLLLYPQKRGLRQIAICGLTPPPNPRVGFANNFFIA